MPTPGQFLLAFVPLLVAMDPIGLPPLFVAMTRGLADDHIRRVTRQAVLTAAVVAIGFMFAGQALFRALGIGVADFQVAGGLVLLIMALRDLAGTSATPPPSPDDFGVVPLGMPLITGPATLAALLVQFEVHGAALALSAFVCNLALVYLALRFAHQLQRLIGVTGLKAASKIILLLLAAIAVHMIRRGWQGGA